MAPSGTNHGKNTKVSYLPLFVQTIANRGSYSRHLSLPSQATKARHFRKEVLFQARKRAHARQNPDRTSNRHLLRLPQPLHRHIRTRARLPKPTRRNCFNVARRFPQRSRIPEPFLGCRICVSKSGGPQCSQFELFQVLVQVLFF
jgi:hypothetical protein